MYKKIRTYTKTPYLMVKKMLSGIKEVFFSDFSCTHRRMRVYIYMDATLLQRRHKDHKRFEFFSMYQKLAPALITGIIKTILNILLVQILLNCEVNFAYN